MPKPATQSPCGQRVAGFGIPRGSQGRSRVRERLLVLPSKKAARSSLGRWGSLSEFDRCSRVVSSRWVSGTRCGPVATGSVSTAVRRDWSNSIRSRRAVLAPPPTSSSAVTPVDRPFGVLVPDGAAQLVETPGEARTSRSGRSHVAPQPAANELPRIARTEPNREFSWRCERPALPGRPVGAPRFELGTSSPPD